MTNKIVFLAFVLIIFAISIDGSTAGYPPNHLVKRAGNTLAHAEFDAELVAIFTFAENGNTTFIYGLVSKGLNCDPQFLIKDKCGNTIIDVTGIFDVQLDGEGGTAPFFREVSSSVLDLSSILATTCNPNQRKRQNSLTGANLSVSSSNTPPSTAAITPP